MICPIKQDDIICKRIESSTNQLVYKYHNPTEMVGEEGNISHTRDLHGAADDESLSARRHIMRGAGLYCAVSAVPNIPNIDARIQMPDYHAGHKFYHFFQ